MKTIKQKLFLYIYSKVDNVKQQISPRNTQTMEV